jgi:hypothetical protein
MEQQSPPKNGGNGTQAHQSHGHHGHDQHGYGKHGQGQYGYGHPYHNYRPENNMVNSPANNVTHNITINGTDQEQAQRIV